MRAERLLNAIGQIDDALVHAAEHAPSKPKRRPWGKWGELAACLVLVVGGVLALPALFGSDPGTLGSSGPGSAGVAGTQENPFAGTQAIPAEGLFNSAVLLEGAAVTDDYDILHAEGVGNSPVRDSTDAATLPVYHSLRIESSDDVYRPFLQSVEDLVARAGSLGMELTVGKLTESSMPYNPDMPRTSEHGMYHFEVVLTWGEVQLEYYWGVERGSVNMFCSGLEQLYLTKYGELPAITADHTDAQVLEALKPVEQFASTLLGTQYALKNSVNRHEMNGGNGIWVTARVTKESAGKDYLSGDTVGFELVEQSLQLVSIRLKDSGDGVYRLDWLALIGEHYEYIGNYELISLEEAEELLHKGYIFSRTSCPVCSANNPEVDFSDYDAVEVIYRNAGAEYEIPVYAFYKDLGMKEYNDGSGTYRAYARVCVPAVEIDGLEEWFARRAALHEELDVGKESES